ncbi:MAG: HU family DNA-binding protein [Bacteroidetes bacterium]|nr:HU family DNA-binding protein [Bacteroidota bacterium]MBK7568358.1 HU family DNA-binding protein [Bacteroidota bacterium]
MQKITQHIVKLLHDHNYVIVPGFGGFVTNYQPAKVHPTSFIFNSPSKSVAFNVNLTSNDGLLINTIAREDQVPIKQAEDLITEFVVKIREALHEHKPVKLAGIGRLTLDVENNIQFLPDNSQNFLMQSYGLYSFTAQPVAREQKSFEVKPLKAITVAKPRKKRTFADSLLPIAAVLLLTMLTMQIFIQTSMNGFDYAEIFGMKKVFAKNTYLLEKYEPVKFEVNPGIVYFRKTDTLTIRPTIAPITEVKNEPVIKNNLTPVVTNENKYILVAGSYYSAAQVEIILNKIQSKGYTGYNKPWGKYQIVAISIPDNISPSSFREIFITDTGIKDAWVTRNK